MLRREVEQVLADPSFERSPVQTRLLRYLCEQTVARNRNISQLAVAVDGLGRPETIDQLTESYPRVQISRLRRNLSLYYARCQPGEGLAVYIRHGDYQLRLAPPESAYGEQRTRGGHAAAVNDTAAEVPAPVPPSRAGLVGWNRSTLLAVTLLALVALGSLWFANRGQVESGGKAPSFEVWVDEPAAAGAPDPLLVLAAQHATDVAANSYVMRNLTPREASGRPDYIVQLSRSQNRGLPVLTVALFDRSNQRLFHDSIPATEDPSADLARFDGAMVHIAGPVGVIATRELATIGQVPRNDYECVLKTESDRLRTGSVSTVVIESCLERFPQSEFRAYWFSRLAYFGYREQVLSGGVVEAKGAPWEDLQRAFAADPNNPSANYIAAKVSFARGDCEAGESYAERALTNGNFYGTLIAATLGDASLCSGIPAPYQDAAARIENLVEAVPEPNPLLHIYLIFASAAVDRPDLARRLLTARTSQTPQGSLAEISGALDAALASPAGFDLHRARLQQVVDSFYWGAQSRQRIMDKLEVVAAYPT